jgi:hypothetical protein
MTIKIFGYSITLTIAKTNVEPSQKLLNWLEYHNIKVSKISLIKALREISKDDIGPTVGLSEAKIEVERMFDFIDGEVIIK